jgi:hypothetical protein
VRLHRLSSLLIAAAIVLSAATASAIPPFARRYGFACSTCHVGGPTKLNPFGEAFRDNGYRIPGDDPAFLQQQQIKLGDPKREMLFPGTIWPGELPMYAPVGVSGNATVTATLPNSGSTDAKTIVPEMEIHLLTGASIGKHFSIFGVVEGGTDGIALDQLHLVTRSLFEDVLGEETLNIKLGRFELDIFPIQPGLHRSALTPAYLTMSLGQDGWNLGDPKEAIEIYGLLFGRLKWVLGVANGSKPIDDLTSRRDFFGRISAKIGGLRLDYKNVRPEVDDSTALNLGFSFYTGREVATPMGADRIGNNVYRLLADARLRTKHDFDLIGQVVLGQDSNPAGDYTPVRHLTWLVGLDYSIFPWLQPYARFEEVRFDASARPNQDRLVAGVAVFVRVNLRLRVEGAVGLNSTDSHVLLAEAFFAM